MIMERKDEIANLIVMTAHARVLAALSTNRLIIKEAEKVKDIGLELAKSLGMSENRFNQLSIESYMTLSKGIK